MNCAKTSVGKPHDEVQGLSWPSRLHWEGCSRSYRRAGCYLLWEPSKVSVCRGSGTEVINFGRFTDGSNVTEAKLGETFGQWLDW